MLAKKPIITSLYAKHNNLVEEIKCGYAVEYDNSDDMVKKIEKIYSLDDAQKETMGNYAYEYVKKNHDIKLMVDKLDDLINNLYKGKHV